MSKKTITVTPTVEGIPQLLVEEIKEGITFLNKIETCRLMGQVEVGRRLSELRKIHGGDSKGGRPETSKSLGGFVPWPKYVKETFAISDETARNWMKMAEEAKPRLKKLDPKLALLLDKPIHLLTESEAAALKKATAKLTTGKTQLDFMRELGLVKMSAAAPGGTKASAAKGAETKAEPEAEDDGKVSPEEFHANDLWKTLIKHLRAELKENQWAHLPRTGEVSIETIHGLLLDLGRVIAPVRNAKGGA